jgi:O-antigen/teichoic acid export membrane protein
MISVQARLRARLQAWKQDRLLGRVLRNTGYLFSGSAISMVLSLVQSVVAAWLLGLTGFGILGAITLFTSTVNRLFSFRMGELVIKYMDRFRAEGRPDRAAAVVKAAGLAEAGTSLLAFGLLVLLSPWAAVTFAKDIQYAPLFLLYGLTIPGNLMTETATGVLQIHRRFKSQAWLNVGQSVLTMALILLAFLLKAGMEWVVLAYLIGKIILGGGPMVLAWRSLNEIFGPGWRKAPFSLLPPVKELAAFATSTNLSATLNLVVRDSELLWVSYFLSPEAAALYKVALAIINPVMMPISQFINTTYPELSRSASERAWAALRRLLRRVTLIAGGWTALASVGLAIFGPLVLWVYGRGKADFQPAYPALLVLLVGFGIANTLFWNRSLLLALHKPGFPFWVTLVTGLSKVALSFVLVPRFGLLAQTGLLSAYLAISVGIITWRGLKEVKNEERNLTTEA